MDYKFLFVGWHLIPTDKFDVGLKYIINTMTTCISRRAFGDHLRFRLINDKGENGRWIWLEYRCPNEVCNDGEVCRECSYKIPGHKYQANQKFNHGKIGGPYTAESKLYGSPYYLEEIKRGWKAAEHDELRAKAALSKSISEMPRKKTAIEAPVPEVPVVEVPVVVAPVALEAPVEKKKRAYNRKKTVIAETPPVVSEVKALAPEKPKLPKLKTPRAKKILPTEVLLPQVQVVEKPADLVPKFVEVVETPLTVTEFVVVKVKKIKSQGKDYYYDSSSGKVYGISVNGVGAYKGRYKEDDDIVDTSFPDSDNE
jgi:hypothetical protein